MPSQILKNADKGINKNPFDVFFSKTKQNIIGKDSRSVLRTSSNTKREERVAERSRKQSKTGNFTFLNDKPKRRKTCFNLSDNEDDAYVNVGQSLSQIESFDREINQNNRKTTEKLQPDQLKHDRMTEIISKSKTSQAKSRRMADKSSHILDGLNFEWSGIEKGTTISQKSIKDIPFSKVDQYDSLVVNLKSCPPKSNVNKLEKTEKQNEMKEELVGFEDTEYVRMRKQRILRSADALEDEFEFILNFESSSNFEGKKTKKPKINISKFIPFLVSAPLLTMEGIFNTVVSIKLVYEIVKDDKLLVPQLIGACLNVLESFVQSDSGFLTAKAIEITETPVIPVAELDLTGICDMTSVVILHSICVHLHNIFDIYKHLPSFEDLFHNLRTTIISVCENNRVPSHIKGLLTNVLETFDRICGESVKVYLVYPPKEVKQIKQYFPRIGETMRVTSDMKMEKRKKRSQLREIRRDSGCEARRKLKETIFADNERRRKTKEIEKLLSAQEGNYKASKKDRVGSDL